MALGLGELLKKARDQRGLSMRRAADELGVADLTYRMWEKGTWAPQDLKRIPALAMWIGCTRADLLAALDLISDADVKALTDAGTPAAIIANSSDSRV